MGAEGFQMAFEGKEATEEGLIREKMNSLEKIVWEPLV